MNDNTRLVSSLLTQLAEIAESLGISDEDAECSNGNAEIIIAIEALKNSVLLYSDGYTNARNQIKMLQQEMMRVRKIGTIVMMDDGQHIVAWENGTPDVGEILYVSNEEPRHDETNNFGDLP